MPDEEVVDTMLCDILEATEWKVGKIFDDSDSRCGEEHEWMTKLNICLIPLKKIPEINYTHGSLKQPMTKDILWSVTISLFIREWLREGGYSEQK